MKRLVAVLLILLTVAACSGPTLQPENQATSELTATATAAPLAAPDFTLTALDGSTFALSAQRGRWVVINFWATWCEPCKVEMPDLQRIVANYADRLTLVGINMRESREAVEAFAAEHGLRFPLLLDPGDLLLGDYLVMGLPLTVVVDPDGNIAMRQFGPVDPDFQSRLAALLGS